MASPYRIIIQPKQILEKVPTDAYEKVNELLQKNHEEHDIIVCKLIRALVWGAATGKPWEHSPNRRIKSSLWLQVGHMGKPVFFNCR